MANVWLTREQCRRDDLPAVCAKCGAATERTVPRRFVWCPWWFVLFLVLSLPGIIIAYFALRRRQRVRVPLCDRHANEWRRHGLFGRVSLVTCGGLFVAGLALDAELGRRTRWVGELMVASGLIGFIVCLIVVAVWSSFLIRPRKMTRDDILLTGVSPAFADAVEDADRRRGYGEYDDDDDRPRRNRYEGDED